ncbi:MAG TPA: fimbria/pilus outer membrane usher protein [Candidatus Baltobacteraceae bacterium]|jgi:outer membrane usher protein
MKRALAALLAILTFTGAAPVASPGTRVFVTLRINTIDQGEAVAVLVSPDILIPVAALEGAGIRGFKGTRSTIYGQAYVSLASLAPDVTFKFDQDALALDVTVQAGLLPRSTYDLGAGRPTHLEYVTSDSAYLNYALSAARGGVSTGFFEGGFTRPGGEFYSSISAVSGSSITRGLTYFEHDDRATEIRRSYGDALVETGDLGGSAFIGGFSSTRAFELDPYAIHFPQPSISGAVTSPSTADVYVNGVLTNRITLAPGTFDLSRIPVTNGSANTTVVVTDAFGRSQTYEQGYYSNAALLDPGTSDFEYGAGMLRRSAFAIGDHYAGFAAAGRYRVGLSNTLSAGMRLEAAARTISLGPSADIGLPIGFLHLAAAYSRSAGESGRAFSVGYNFVAPRFGVGAAVVGESSRYATLSQDPDADRALLAISAFASLQVGRRSSVGFQYFHRIDRDTGAATQTAITDTMSIGRSLSLTLMGQHATGAEASATNAISLALNVALGRRNLVASTQVGTGGPDTAVQIQQSPPGTHGLGYVASVDQGRSTAFNGSLQYRGYDGDYGFDYSHDVNGEAGYDVRASGGLALIGGGIFATRPIDDAYALVDLPGLGGVHVYLNNQDMGKTDARGKLLVPGLLANYGNLLRISDDGAPLDASIQTLERTIAPPVRGGAVVTFPVRRIRALVGKLRVRLHGAQVVPAYGDLSVDGGDVHADSAIGDDGEFYLEDVPTGTYRAVITYKQGTCEFSLKEPDVAGVLVNLGTLECVVP